MCNRNTPPHAQLLYLLALGENTISAHILPSRSDYIRAVCITPIQHLTFRVNTNEKEIPFWLYFIASKQFTQISYIHHWTSLRFFFVLYYGGMECTCSGTALRYLVIQLIAIKSQENILHTISPLHQLETWLHGFRLCISTNLVEPVPAAASASCSLLTDVELGVVFLWKSSSTWMFSMLLILRCIPAHHSCTEWLSELSNICSHRSDTHWVHFITSLWVNCTDSDEWTSQEISS